MIGVGHHEVACDECAQPVDGIPYPQHDQDHADRDDHREPA
jgi:hypothetical protein